MFRLSPSLSLLYSKLCTRSCRGTWRGREGVGKAKSDTDTFSRRSHPNRDIHLASQRFLRSKLQCLGATTFILVAIKRSLLPHNFHLLPTRTKESTTAAARHRGTKFAVRRRPCNSDLLALVRTATHASPLTPSLSLSLH